MFSGLYTLSWRFSFLVPGRMIPLHPSHSVVTRFDTKGEVGPLLNLWVCKQRWSEHIGPSGSGHGLRLGTVITELTGKFWVQRDKQEDLLLTGTEAISTTYSERYKGLHLPIMLQDCCFFSPRQWWLFHNKSPKECKQGDVWHFQQFYCIITFSLALRAAAASLRLCHFISGSSHFEVLMSYPYHKRRA